MVYDEVQLQKKINEQCKKLQLLGCTIVQKNGFAIDYVDSKDEGMHRLYKITPRGIVNTEAAKRAFMDTSEYSATLLELSQSDRNNKGHKGSKSVNCCNILTYSGKRIKLPMLSEIRGYRMYRRIDTYMVNVYNGHEMLSSPIPFCVIDPDEGVVQAYPLYYKAIEEQQEEEKLWQERD